MLGGTPGISRGCSPERYGEAGGGRHLGVLPHAGGFAYIRYWRNPQPDVTGVEKEIY
jgi:hypothetical protein